MKMEWTRAGGEFRFPVKFYIGKEGWKIIPKGSIYLADTYKIVYREKNGEWEKLFSFPWQWRLYNVHIMKGGIVCTFTPKIVKIGWDGRIIWEIQTFKSQPPAPFAPPLIEQLSHLGYLDDKNMH